MFLYIVTVIYILNVTNFEILISWKRWELAKILRYGFYRGWYLPSNETIANVVLRDFDQNFQRQTFQVAIRSSLKMQNTTAIE